MKQREREIEKQGARERILLKIAYENNAGGKERECVFVRVCLL